MRAVAMTAYGSTDVLEIRDFPDPIPSAGEVVVTIRAASINGADPNLRSGASRYDQMTFPHIPGRDFAGVVSEVTADSDFQLGDEVFGVCLRGTDGGQAEKIAISAAIVALKPATLDFVEAAALALTGITALYALEDVAAVSPGQRVLIQGGAGGVGGVAVQLAKHLGATVVSTASPQNHDYVRSLGADEVIDYRTTDVTTLGQSFDVVYDTVGGVVQTQSAAVVKSGGILVVCAPGTEDTAPSRADIDVVRPTVGRDRAHLDRISELVELGALRAPTITRFPIESVRDAHLISEGRHLQGKLVLEIR